MANSTILEELFVRVGWKVDDKTRKDAESAVDKVAKQAVKSYLAMQAALAGVVAGVTEVAEHLEQLYFMANRAATSVAAFSSLSYALRNVGGSAEGAAGAVEALGRFLRNTPSGGAFLASLGVSLRDGAHRIRNTSDILVDLGRRMAAMPAYRAQAYANVLGIDYQTLIAIQQDLGPFREQYLGLLRAANFDQNAAGASAHRYMVTLRSLMATATVLSDKLMVELEGPVRRGMAELQAVIVANYKPIAHAIENVAHWVFFFADTSFMLIRRGVELLQQLGEWYESLDPQMQKVIKSTVLFVGALKLMQTAFMASPVGRVLALGAAILALYDDYEVWKKGGQSAIDWGPFQDSLKKIGAEWDKFGAQLHGLIDAILELFNIQVPANWGFKDIVIAALNQVAGAIHDVTEAIAQLKAAFEWLNSFKNRITPADPAHPLQLGPGGNSNPMLSVRPRPGTQAPPTGPWFPEWLWGDWSFLWGGAQKEIKKGVQHSAVQLGALRLQKVLADGARDMFRGIDLGGNWVDQVSAAATQLGGAGAGGMLQLAGYTDGGPSVPRGSPYAGGGGYYPPEGQARIKQALDFFRSRGWTAAQAAGIVANLWAESGLNPNAYNGGGGGMGAQGIAQWRAGRILAIEQHFGKPLRSMSLQEQLEAVQWELQGRERAAGGALGAARTPYDAGAAFQQYYERGGPQYVAPRGQAAQGLFAQHFGAAAEQSRSFTFNQHTHIQIMGNADEEGARKLRRVQDRVHADLWRNFRAQVI